jgi:mono/diheme cytochrome c family protein
MRPLRLYKLALFLLTALLAACADDSPGDTSGADRAADAKALENPVPATPESIASGRTAFARLCADCHGAAGDGVSALAAEISANGDVHPLNLTDESWIRGSSDGEIFTVIRDGLPDGSMKGLNGRPGVSANDMWNLVNYVRSLGPPR